MKRGTNKMFTPNSSRKYVNKLGIAPQRAEARAKHKKDNENKHKQQKHKE